MRDRQAQARPQADGGARAGQMRSLRTLAFAGAAIAVLAVVAFAVTRGLSPSSRAAPALPRQRLVGPRVSIASLRGRPALVLFWASWCGQCRREAQAVRSFAQSPAGEGRIVGVDWADRPRAARAFLRRQRWSFSNLRDPTGEVGLSYGLAKLPALFVIGASGEIRRAISGVQTKRSLEAALRSG